MASVTILDNQPVKTKKIENINFSITKFKTGKRISVINEVLPFRIRFTAIQIPGYSPTSVPPIPLQIIGFSNYIL
jgi:hypothetical protein